MVETKLYVKKTYAIWRVPVIPAGTENISTVQIASGILALIIHGLALSHFVCVLSTILPINRSETPSNILEMAITDAAVPVLIPTTET